MDQYGLTAKQLKLFKFIKNYIARSHAKREAEEVMADKKYFVDNLLNEEEDQ
jgi:hypothetical protein